MIHLFHKIYIDTDKLFKPSVNRIVISDVFGGFGEISSLALHQANGTVPKLPLLSAVSYESLIRDSFAGDDNKFFQYLMSCDPNEKVVIYCDAPTVLILITKFWRTLFGNWTADQYVTMVNYYLTVYQEMLGCGHTPFAKTSPAEATSMYTDYSAILHNNNVAELKERWANATPYRITRAQREDIVANTSIELQLASVLVNPNWRHGDVLKAKISRMMRKELIHEFLYNVRFVILDGLVNFNKLVPSTTFDATQHTVTDLVAMHPEYSFITDPKFHPDYIDYVFSTYDMNQLRTIHELVTSTRYAFEIDWAPLFIQTLSFDDAIAYEMERPMTRLFMRYGDYHEKTVPYIIDALIDAVRNNTITTFAFLELK